MSTIQEQLQTAIVKGIPKLDAQVLLAQVLGVSREHLYSRAEETVSSKDIERFNTLVSRRLAGEPIAYIVEKKEFWSLSLQVNNGVLIPRPETELLVEKTLALFPESKESINILELGTGSGAIALALAIERPQWSIFATDISEEALDLAKNNAKRFSLNNVSFYLGDWFEALPSPKPLFHAIISNPPYIARNDRHLASKELSFEPLIALQAGDNGLENLKIIISAAQGFLLSKAWLLLEHGYDQAEDLAAFFKAKNYLRVETYKDLAGVNRVTVGQKP